MTIIARIKKHPRTATSLLVATFGIAGAFVFEAKPAYDGYVERSNFTMCITQGSEVKATYSEYLITNKQPPLTLLDLGLGSQGGSEYLDEVVLRADGFDLRCGDKAGGVTFKFQYATDGDDNISWRCEAPPGLRNNQYTGCG